MNLKVSFKTLSNLQSYQNHNSAIKLTFCTQNVIIPYYIKKILRIRGCNKSSNICIKSEIIWNQMEQRLSYIQLINYKLFVGAPVPPRQFGIIDFSDCLADRLAAGRLGLPASKKISFFSIFGTIFFLIFFLCIFFTLKSAYRSIQMR